MARPDPYILRVARAIADSVLREQLAKEAKADAERAQADATLRAVLDAIRKNGGRT